VVEPALVADVSLREVGMILCERFRNVVPMTFDAPDSSAPRRHHRRRNATELSGALA